MLISKFCKFIFFSVTFLEWLTWAFLLLDNLNVRSQGIDDLRCSEFSVTLIKLVSYLFTYNIVLWNYHIVNKMTRNKQGELFQSVYKFVLKSYPCPFKSLLMKGYINWQTKRRSKSDKLLSETRTKIVATLNSAINRKATGNKTKWTGNIFYLMLWFIIIWNGTCINM